LSNVKEPVFTVVDKRHQYAEESQQDTPKVQEAPANPAITEFTRKRRWKSVGYMIAMGRGPSGETLILGRAVGLRMDGDKPFVADYILPPLYPRGLDWTAEVTKRLDTFLGCECKEHHACDMHKNLIPGWMTGDMKRIGESMTVAVPEAIEVLMRLEQIKSKTPPLIICPGQR
jgi:hypothetical protein